MPIDVERSFETPEGISLSFQIAGPIVRACAWAVDAVIRSVIYLVLGLLSEVGEFGTGIFLLGFFLLEWFYPVFFEVLKGATPGKKMFHLSVCMDNGTPIGWGASILRNFLRTVDFLPLLYMTGLIAMLCNRNFKRLGDLVAGTLVVYDDSVDHSLSIPEAVPASLPLMLRPEEQRAILDFAERSSTLSQARQQELASLLSLPDSGEALSTQQLLSHAQWIQKGGQA